MIRTMVPSNSPIKLFTIGLLNLYSRCAAAALPQQQNTNGAVASYESAAYGQGQHSPSGSTQHKLPSYTATTQRVSVYGDL
jgi:hypothetical protein